MLMSMWFVVILSRAENCPVVSSNAHAHTHFLSYTPTQHTYTHVHTHICTHIYSSEKICLCYRLVSKDLPLVQTVGVQVCMILRWKGASVLFLYSLCGVSVCVFVRVCVCVRERVCVCV